MCQNERSQWVEIFQNKFSQGVEICQTADISTNIEMSIDCLHPAMSVRQLSTESRTLIWKKGQSGPISLKHDFVLQWDWTSCFSGLTPDLFSNYNGTKSQSSLSLLG